MPGMDTAQPHLPAPPRWAVCLDCGHRPTAHRDDSTPCAAPSCPCEIPRHLVGIPTIGTLFSGTLALDLAVEQVFGGRTLWGADIDPGAAKIMAHHRPNMPNLHDITRINWAGVPRVTILTGGSPCQDLSHAGRQRGMTEGTRSNLWLEMLDAIRILKPRLVAWENVRGALTARADSNLEFCPGCMGDEPDQPVLRALGRVLGDLSNIGYVARWFGLRISDLGGCHGRWRIFLLAYPEGDPWWLYQRDGGLVANPGSEHGPQWGFSAAIETARRGALGEPAGRAGTPALVILPTPMTTDGGSNSPSDNLRRAPGLRTAPSMFPTPSVADSTGGHERRGGARSDELLLKGLVKLFPTPAACNPNDGESIESWEARRIRIRTAERVGNGNGMGTPLSVAVQVLPTPTTAPSTGNGHARNLGAEASAAAIDWGAYGLAIASHAELVGRPAPPPTEQNWAAWKAGRARRFGIKARRLPAGMRGSVRRWATPPPHRLSPRFVEWMMCLPDGWVTGVPGLTRIEQLKALGNGVCPPQAVFAFWAMIGFARDEAA